MVPAAWVECARAKDLFINAWGTFDVNTALLLPKAASLITSASPLLVDFIRQQPPSVRTAIGALGEMRCPSPPTHGGAGDPRHEGLPLRFWLKLSRREMSW